MHNFVDLQSKYRLINKHTNIGYPVEYCSIGFEKQMQQFKLGNTTKTGFTEQIHERIMNVEMRNKCNE